MTEKKRLVCETNQEPLGVATLKEVQNANEYS